GVLALTVLQIADFNLLHVVTKHAAPGVPHPRPKCGHWRILLPLQDAPRQLAKPFCPLYVLILVLPNRFFQPSPLWLTKSSSRRKPAKPKTSAPPLVLATETSSRPKAICSTCSNRRML